MASVLRMRALTVSTTTVKGRAAHLRSSPFKGALLADSSALPGQHSGQPHVANLCNSISAQQPASRGKGSVQPLQMAWDMMWFTSFWRPKGKERLPHCLLVHLHPVE